MLKKAKMIIYTNEGCVNCEVLKRALEDEGIEYEERNTENNMPEAVKLAERVGSSILPLVVHLGKEYSNPNINELI